MDESKPAVPSSEFHSRSASERIAADIDPPPAELANSDALVAVERQNRSGRIEICRSDFSDGPSVAVYYRNDEEVREGFLIALALMGGAPPERLPEPAKPPVRGGKAAPSIEKSRPPKES
jgi:hypothetical protein